jgi:hypothetical protein
MLPRNRTIAARMPNPNANFTANFMFFIAVLLPY